MTITEFDGVHGAQAGAGLVVSNMSKSFGGQKALDDVSLTVQPGEIRALVGQNGCGKSTLIKILAGFHLPDPGVAVTMDGKALALGQPGAADELGLRFVHQDLGLVATLDAVDNMALGVGYHVGRTGRIHWRREVAGAREAMKSLGCEIDVRRPVGDLAMSERTTVAIARALAPRRSQPRLLVLDEPTANLPADEASRLYELVRRVSRTGVAVLFVSHHFDEVFDLADSVTVLRDGRHVETSAVGGLTEDRLVALVVGRSLQALETGAGAVENTPNVLTATAVSGQIVKDLDVGARQGEIVGVAGITGSGREEVASLLFGGAPRRGEVRVDGQIVAPGRPDRSMAAGMALVPAERHANAAFMEADLTENITVVNPGHHFVGGTLRSGRERSDVAAWLARLDVRPREPGFQMAALSGGNQQKVVLARWLRQAPPLLLLDEPTQGVDVGAKADIYGLIRDAAAEGTAVVIMSTDHEELASLCHRVLVLRGGRLVNTLSGDQLNPDHLTAAVIGRQGGSA